MMGGGLHGNAGTPNRTNDHDKGRHSNGFPAVRDRQSPDTGGQAGTPTWAVRLRSKHTGQEVTLGVRYSSREQAEVAAAAECDRCNRITVVPVHDGWGA